jgi:hypothetical protein
VEWGLKVEGQAGENELDDFEGESEEYLWEKEFVIHCEKRPHVEETNARAG